jgi:nucleoside-triphosphatase
MANVYLLTGSPGTGKTTIIREVVATLKIKAGGFYTQEIRAGGIRQGFKITTLTGQEAVLSHVDISSPYRVSKYGVDISNLENIGVIAIYHALKESDLIIIDEIGKMELFSLNFREAVLKAINSGKKVLGTIMLSPHPFADQVKKHPQVKIVHVSRVNRDKVLVELLNWLNLAIHENHS